MHSRNILAAVSLPLISLLAAGCGGDGSSSPAKSKTYQQEVAFVQCARTHGVPAFPRPAAGGVISTSQVNIGSPGYATAISDCLRLLPNNVEIRNSQAQQQALLAQFLKFSACIRAHGIPDFPDPTDQDGSVGIHGVGGVPRGSLLLKAAGQACRSLEPGA